MACYVCSRRCRRMMRVGLMILVGMLATVAPGFSRAAGPPALPSSFHGQVTANGASAPTGTLITVGHGGTVYARTAAFTYEGVSHYSVNIPGDDPDAPGHDGGTEGEALEFTIGGLPTTHAPAVWHSGTNETLDISAQGNLPTRGTLHLPLLMKR